MKEGYKKTEVGVIPEEWEVVKLSDCTEKITDGSHSSPVLVEGSNYKICTVANMKGNSLDLSSSANISEEDFEKLIKNGCGPEYGDVLLSKDGTIGKTILFEQSNENVVLLSSIAILRPSSIKLNGKYLNQYLRDSRTLTRMTNTKTGSAIKRIVLRDIKDLKIVLPCLKEQEKIAEILSTVDCQIDDTEKLIEKCRVLKKGLMQRLLTKGIGHTEFKKSEVGEIPVSWEVKYSNDVFNLVTDYVANGSFASLNENVTYKNEEDHAVLIRLTDYKNGYSGSFVYVDKKAYEFLGKSKLESEDIIIANVGAYAGYVFKAPKWQRPMTLGPNAILVRTDEIKDYIYYWLSSEIGQKSLKNIISTTAQPKFNKTDFKKIFIPIPPREEQEEIVEVLLSMDKEIEEYRNKKQKLEELKKGLMQQLLTGQIRTI